MKNYWNSHLSKKLGSREHGAMVDSARRVSKVSEASSSVNSTEEASMNDARESREKAKVTVETQESHSNNIEIQAGEQQVMGITSCGMSSLWDFDSLTTLFHEYSNDDLSWLPS